MVSLIKLIFSMKNKKAADLKLQQRISKKSSFSRYLENAKSRINVTIFVWFYLQSRPELFCEEAVFRNFRKLTGKHLGRSVFLKNFQV